MGHGLEMAKGAEVSLLVDTGRLEILPGVLEYAAMGLVPEGTYRNKKFQKEDVLLDASVTEDVEDLLFDPQTSGGLLVSVEEALAEEILRELKAAGLPTRAAVIGRVTEKREKYLYAGRGIL